MNDMIKDQLAQRETEAKRWAAIEQHAKEQGLVMLAVSQRVYQIIKIGSSKWCWRGELPGGSHAYFTSLEGGVVFRGNFLECRKYLAAHSVSLPPELEPK